MENDADWTTSGEAGYGAHGYSGSHRGNGRHPWSPGRSLRGARTESLGDTAQPPVPGPSNPPPPSAPHGHGTRKD